MFNERKRPASDVNASGLNIAVRGTSIVTSRAGKRATMEKVLQRAKYAERMAVKRTQKRKAYLGSTEAWQREKNTQRLGRVFSKNIVEARKNRQVDWQTGALAPRRDVGERATTYGSMSIYDFNLPELGPEEQLEWFPIREGDRVVVIKGREQGKIGEVGDVQRDRNGVRINGLNQVDVVVPEWIGRQEGDTRELNTVPRYFPIEHVRLVYPLPDPKTGIPRDVIIDRLEPINRYYDRDAREMNDGERVISGTTTVIPWPASAEPEVVSHEADTRGVEVEENPTFRPYLLSAPMPMSVIDELRGKYSKFRTRHEPDYIEKKEAEVERERRRQDLGKTMRTPLQELAELRAKQKREAERELTEEQLAKIGEVIAQEEQKVFGAVKQVPGEV